MVRVIFGLESEAGIQGCIQPLVFGESQWVRVIFGLESEAGIQGCIQPLVLGESSWLGLYLVWKVRLAYRAVSSLWCLVSRLG